MVRNFARLVCLSLAMMPTAGAQTVSGQISARVVDRQGGVLIGATVRLTSELTQQVREFTTDSNGSFIFASLVPGTYSLRVETTGFKAYDQQGIKVSAQERVDLHDIALELGEMSATVQVQAEGVHVATDSSSRAINVTRLQIEDTPIRGRNYMGILRTLPGVQDLNNYDRRGWGSGNPTINGGRAGQTLVTLDGVASQDSGAPSLNSYIAPSIDAIAEVQVMTSNYNAEYGARSGGQMNVTIKNGTSQFHGSGYFFWRNEAFWKNGVTKVLLDGWRLNGIGTLYYGAPITIGCSATAAPIGHWTGTPTGGIPFRCQMGNDIWLPAGSVPPSITDARLWYPFNSANFSLPPPASLGIGNTPPTLLYGPGVANLDLALAKEFRVGRSESRALELKVEAFNAFNHFNPGNPNTSLTLNFNTGANTNAAFGNINGAQISARRAILSVRFRF